MERVRVVFFVCLLAIGLLFCPSEAYANDGFLGGLEDLVGVREVGDQNDYEKDYIDSYEPEVGEVKSESVRSLGDDATTVDYVNDTVDSFNRSGYRVNLQDRDLLFGLQMFLGQRSNVEKNLYLIPAVSIVFILWGVKKAIRMIMASFRKGSASI